jgi:TonB-linked SusC/RagA family outer membrane protein
MRKKEISSTNHWECIKKLLLIMKISSILIFVSFIQLSANVLSQETKINLKINDGSISDVFNEIENQSDFKIFYNVNQIDLSKRISYIAQERSISTVLEDLLGNLGVSYELFDKVIVIVPASLKQTMKITGTVTDATTGEPLPGVNIVIKGSTIGVISDMNGNYSIEVPGTDAILVFSFIGYLQEEVAVSGQSSINIGLSPDIKKLDEVVVIGYGTVKKKDLTGSVASANIKDFEKSPNTNLIQSLQGIVPGLNIGQVTSAGATPDISIRGKNTISGNTNVLIVMDGIIYNNSLSSINPADIETVDILKDASATAVYGAQAANGVILITSKKGKAGKAKITLSSSYSIQNPTHNYSTMNRDQYLTFLRNLMWDKAYTKLSGYTEDSTGFNLASQLPETYMRDANGNISETDFDWWGACTRNASILDNQLTISGGNDALSYLVSFGNTDQKNLLVNDNFKRNSARVNLDASIRPWWKLGTQLSGSFVNQDGSEPVLWTLYSMNPLASAYNADGSINPSPMEMARDNPLIGSNISDQERHNYFIANLYSEFRLPVKGLTYRINFGNNYTINNHFQASPYASSRRGQAYKDYSTSYNYTIDNIFNYTKDFGLHGIMATLVYGVRENNYSQTRAEANQFSNLTLGYNGLEVGTIQLTTSDANSSASLYQMARVNYKYDNKYLLTATIRKDGFSGFASNFKSAYFPSVAVGWVVSDESFFKSISAINYLKLRGGYGISGNLTGIYSSLARVSTGSGYVFGDGATAVIRQELTSMENKDLKWEKTAGFNFGLDFNLLKDRIQGTMEVYRTKTNDLLYDVSIPTITGFGSIKSNIGNIQNQGIEFTFTSRNIVTRNFEWSTTFNIYSNKNKVLKLTGSDGDNNGIEDDLITSGLFIGQPLSAVYGYKIDGIYQVGDVIPNGYYTGNYKIHDESGDGSISEADRTILGKTDPAYRFGIMNKVTYKDITLSFFINSVQGGKDGYLGENYYTLIQDNTSRGVNHLNEFTKNVWSPKNPDGIYSASTADGTIKPIRYEDRSFIRLQDISLGYNLPKGLISTIGLENINIYVSGKNLLTITKWHGWDPEANYGTVTPVGRTTSINKSGDDYEGRPVMRSFTFGINVSF